VDQKRVEGPALVQFVIPTKTLDLLCKSSGAWKDLPLLQFVIPTKALDLLCKSSDAWRDLLFL